MSDDAIRISPRTPGTTGTTGGAGHGAVSPEVRGTGAPARRRIHLPVPSELLVLLAAVLGVLISAAVVDDFDASTAWSLVTVLAIGYMLARGLAKRGNADDGI
jgi:hypothetical protein